MANKLSFLSLKCVLEYLEANKRIHISTRSPTIRDIEKSIPLHVDRLVFQDWAFLLNNYSYQILYVRRTLGNLGVLREEVDRHDRECLPMDNVLFPGDILVECHTHPKHTEQMQIIFKSSFRTHTRRLPEGLQFHEALKKLACHLLGGRKDIIVSQLYVETSAQKIIRLPENLKIRVKKMLLGDHDLEPLLQIIDPRSTLKELEFCPKDDKTIEHPIVRAAKKVIICWFYVPGPCNVYLQLPNKHIIINDGGITTEGILTVVERWMTNGPEIGTCLELRRLGRSIENLMNEVKKRFDGYSVNMKEMNKETSWTRGVSLPMSSKSELVIYEYDGGFLGMRNYAKLEVMPSGALIPKEQNATRTFGQKIRDKFLK